jgi:hypothetical protein
MKKVLEFFLICGFCQMTINSETMNNDGALYVRHFGFILKPNTEEMSKKLRFVIIVNSYLGCTKQAKGPAGRQFDIPVLNDKGKL